MYPHSRQLLDPKEMKEIMTIVRRCGYDFTEIPETSGKPQMGARMIVDSTSTNDIGGYASEGGHVDAPYSGRNSVQAMWDDGSHNVPHKRRKRERETEADIYSSS